ncbi:uncharacterized protein LOC106710120 [Papilio machaon]|uniref:uncharacterized protein LOC106710120 n=1 Tax=Papilio machaon TaxID=76193 RepID=UPI001E663C87|nr:uncharacterized protein LOC106710120 [Papilio machaon]
MEYLKDYDNADTISIDTLALEEAVQNEREREILELSSLSKKVCFLHTSILYYRNAKSKLGATCHEAWRTLIKKIGGTPNTWRELGYSLGISQDDLDYIMSTVREDPADTVLKVFMQNENATLDKILDALVKMKRFDILKSIDDPFSILSQSFCKEDSGYHSGSKTSGTREIISFTKNLTNDLPPALNKSMVIKESKRPDKPTLRPPIKTVDTKIEKDHPILFLTFTEDGWATAVNIKQYVENWTDVPAVSVITLNERRDEVYQNPEKFIREYFEKADLIVPIITTGYLNEIRSHTPRVQNTIDNLDFKYASFIYKLIINHYIHASGCLNEKVRSVLPQNAEVNVLTDIRMYPDLTPWTYEENFDETFKVFLNKEYLTF